MTDLFSPFPTPTVSHPSAVSHFFRSSASGRDSPRTLVADELFKLHIGTPPLQEKERKPFTLEIPAGRAKKQPCFNEMCEASTSCQDPLFRTSPTRRRSPRKAARPLLSPLEEMDISEDMPSPIPISGRPISPPPPISPEFSQDSEDDMESLEETRPPDERTRYLRQKKRIEQIIAYRMRELKADRESRAARRGNPFSPKATKVGKTFVKRVKFAL